MNCEFTGEIMPAARSLDGIDVPDQVGNGHVRCGQLFYIAFLRSKPCNWSVVTLLGDEGAAALADGVVRVVMNFATGHIGHLRIEQSGQRTQNTALGLATQTQKDEVMTGKNCVDELRYDRIFIADNAGKNSLA